MKRKFPSSFYNPITLLGTAVATITFTIILFLIIVETISSKDSPYLGIITFIILPTILILGLLLIAFGIYREHFREKHGKHRNEQLPKIDLNDLKQRRAISIFLIGTVVLLIFSAYGSFKAYEYTESVEFCGTVCHKVMNPEYVSHANSPHARVACVACHIGPGTTWWVRSKLSGAYQVYSYIFNKYSKPIPTPVANLRPATGTCEQCHWPNAFYSKMEKKKVYFLSDKENTRMTLTLLINIGGGNEESGVTNGIHWHMNIANKITYLATDSARQVIPWVKIQSKDGKVTIYKSTDIKLSNEQLKNGNYRIMDCIDCHNRPTHVYSPPATSVNDMMADGFIDTTLPYIKSISVQALDEGYTTKQIALDSIRISIEEFYQSNYPNIFVSKKFNIENAIKEVQKIYSLNYFPSMDVSWKKYPNNIGHLYSKGCFRCHDGKHVSSDGKVITKSCTACHTILSQQFGNNKPELSLQGVEYRHPVDVGDSWKNLNCSSCHGKN
jgi:nitrate/TMAO reductase-like tetraheme cytochrome c subunit